MTKNDHFVQKMNFFKELKVQIRTYELRGHGGGGKKKSTMGSHTTPWKKLSRKRVSPYKGLTALKKKKKKN